MDKFTEATIASLIEADKRVVTKKESVFNASAELLNKKAESYSLEAGVKALDHRKSMLDNLVVLWSKGYYSKIGITPTGSAADELSIETRVNLDKK